MATFVTLYRFNGPIKGGGQERFKKFNGIVEIPVLPLVPDLDRTAIARTTLSHPYTFRVVPVRAERRRTGRANPLIAAFVPFVLIVQTFLQRFHELFETAH